MQYLLFALFFVLFASRSLDFDTSLAPGLSVKNAFLYLTFLMLAIETAVTHRRKLELLPVFVPFAVYVFYATFTWLVILLIMDFPGYGRQMSLFALKGGPIEHMMVLLVFFYGVSDTRRALWLLRGITWLVILANVITVVEGLGFLDFGIVRVRDDGRVGGTIGNANQFASFLVLFLPAIVAMYWTAKGRNRLLVGAAAFVSCLAFLMAVSRGAIVGLAAGGAFGAYYLRASIPPHVLVRAGSGALLLVIAVVAAGVIAGYGDVLSERFGAFGENSYEASSGRTMIWGRALERMLEHPVTFVTGFGWHAYENSGFRLAAHSTYLNILYNLGMIGVTLFLLVVGNVLRSVRAGLSKAAPETRPFLIAFVIGFLALMISLLFGELTTTWLYVWAFVGITLRLAVSEPGAEFTSTRTGVRG